MVFDRSLYIDRLKDAGVDDAVARAHAEALRDALFETIATKSDLTELETKLERQIAALDRKIEITARDLTIRGAAALVVIATLIVGLKVFG